MFLAMVLFHIEILLKGGVQFHDVAWPCLIPVLTVGDFCYKTPNQCQFEELHKELRCCSTNDNGTFSNANVHIRSIIGVNVCGDHTQNVVFHE